MINVLFVCLGNICRSPLAEAVFNQLLSEKGLTHSIQSDSAGTSDYHIGEDPDPRTMEVVTKYNLSLNHQARQFGSNDFTDFQYIIAMDSSNKKNIAALLPDRNEQHQQIFLMREFDEEADSLDVPDPYWSGKEGFTQVYHMLQRSCKKLLEHIIREHQLK